MATKLDKEALEIAVSRAAVAKRYAEMFPQFVHGNDVRFQDSEWQYENEGVKAVHPVTSKVDR